MIRSVIGMSLWDAAQQGEINELYKRLRETNDELARLSRDHLELQRQVIKQQAQIANLEIKLAALEAATQDK